MIVYCFYDQDHGGPPPRSWPDRAQLVVLAVLLVIVFLLLGMVFNPPQISTVGDALDGNAFSAPGLPNCKVAT